MPVRVWPGIPTGPSYNGKDGSLLKSRSGFEFQWAFHSIAIRGRIAGAIVLAGEVLPPVRSTWNGWRAGEERLTIPVFALTRCGAAVWRPQAGNTPPPNHAGEAIGGTELGVGVLSQLHRPRGRRQEDEQKRKQAVDAHNILLPRNPAARIGRERRGAFTLLTFTMYVRHGEVNASWLVQWGATFPPRVGTFASHVSASVQRASCLVCVSSSVGNATDRRLCSFIAQRFNGPHRPA